jgi:hypothetical protein
MAFDPLNYNMRNPFPLTLTEGVNLTYTTENVLKKYTPGQYAYTWDPLWGFRIFKLVKNMNDAAITAGSLQSCKDAASVGTITAGSTTSITTSGLTANDLEYQMITISDDAGAAGAAPEGESSLCIGNTTTVITLHPDYAFTAAVAVSDTASVVYINATTAAASGDKRGLGTGTAGVVGVAMGAAADNEWYWACQKGWITAKNTDALAVTNMLIAGTALVQDGSYGAQETEIGHVAVSQFAGTEASFATVYINVFDSIIWSGTP